ncbi:hypothetical protein PG997_014634 [Apiospora hydei]|uniref:Uncharacterized protein n=1 Tax=Apiospora hydei TaxID=1337664 RepID=A0ABR1UUD7_9PEZI
MALRFQFLAGFQCGTHFSALYDGTYDQYYTISFPFAYGLATSDFLLDVWILVLPIPRTFFYTILESGMALVAVNLPSLRVLAISLKTSDLINSMRSIFEFSFLRGSSFQIERHDLEASRAHDGMKRSLSTGPSEGTEKAGTQSDQIPLHAMGHPKCVRL